MDAAQENHVSHIHATGSSRSCSAFCASPSCIRIRLLTAAAPACHGNSFADIYWSRTQGLCTQLPIYQTHAQRPHPPDLLRQPWWPPPATLVCTPGSINSNAYEANLLSLRWGFRQQCLLLNSELFVVAPRSTSPSLLIRSVWICWSGSIFASKVLPAVPVVSVHVCVYILLSGPLLTYTSKTWQRWRTEPCSKCIPTEQCRAMQGHGKERSQQRSTHLSPEFASVPQAALYNFLHHCKADPLWECKMRVVMFKLGF